MDGSELIQAEVQHTKKVNATEETYTELQKVYDFYNERLFDGKLPGALIVMTRRKHTYGYFSPTRFVDVNGNQADEIALNQAYFATRAVEQVLSTMAHEMTHQWQYHFGKPSKRSYHNQEFSQKMEEIGLITSSTGYPGGFRLGEHVSHYIAEDGKFIQATRELLQTSFGILWYDRYPDPDILEAPNENDVKAAIEKAKEQNSASTQDGEVEGGEGDEGKEGEKAQKPGRKKKAPSTAIPATLSAPAITSQPNVANSIGADLSTDIEYGSHPKISARLTGGNFSQPKKSGSRAKYCCPVCHAAVWGKADLRVLCGQDGCDSALMAAI